MFERSCQDGLLLATKTSDFMMGARTRCLLPSLASSSMEVERTAADHKSDAKLDAACFEGLQRASNSQNAVP